jgi:hypothetical protein
MSFIKKSNTSRTLIIIILSIIQNNIIKNEDDQLVGPDFSGYPALIGYRAVKWDV